MFNNKWEYMENRKNFVQGEKQAHRGLPEGVQLASNFSFQIQYSSNILNTLILWQEE